MLTVKPSRLKINKLVILYIFSFLLLILINPETKLSSLAVLVTRLVVVAYVVHILSFKEFSVIYVKVMLFLCVASLPYVLVIYLDLPSFLPDFSGIDDRPLRNFMFFGVWENFITYGTYRNSGIWWEPGAFQLYINIAFMFALLNSVVTKKMYCIFALTILTTQSTTGVLAFLILSVIYFRTLIAESKNKLFYIFIFGLFSAFVVAFAAPFIMLKFGSGAAEQSVSFLSRYYDLVISFNMLKDNLIIGYGFGSQIENAIPYAINYMGAAQHKLINPTGADGLTMLIAQCGMFSIPFLVPLIYPKYSKASYISTKFLLSLVLIIIFNTQNFTFHLIFTLLTLYGIVGASEHKNKLQRI